MQNSQWFSLVFIISIIIILSVYNVPYLAKNWCSFICTQNVQETKKIDLHVIKFNNYLQQFNKSYSGEEYNQRLKNFQASLAEIARLNALEGDTVFGLTQFSDMSPKEFADKMLLKLDQNQATPNEGRKSDFCKDYLTDNETIPESSPRYWDKTVPDKFDWRESGYVSPVLNQRGCKGCWAFAIVGVMETMAAKRNLYHEPLSIQELIDCSTYNAKCLGGNVKSACEFICIKNLPIVSEDNYPLTLKDASCNSDQIKEPLVTLKSFELRCYNGSTEHTRNCESEEELLRVVVNHGPVATIVNAAPWYNYIGGIIRRACVRNENSEKHAVIIVGYDKTGAIPYYIVKNSWGDIFGDHGYVKVAMYHNICGIAQDIYQLDVKKWKPKK